MGDQAHAIQRLVTVSPHRREGETVPLVMQTTMLALLPAVAVGAYVFGWRALVVIAISVASCVATEAAVQVLRGVRVTVGDGSAALTGLLLALVLPPGVNWYVPVVGGVVAIAVAKQAFGGLGCNFFNPALVGRAFLQFAFPAQVSMPKWPILGAALGTFARFAADVTGPDAVTRATPLAVLKASPGVPWSDLAGPDAFGPPLVWLMLPDIAAAIVFAALVLAAGGGIYLAVARDKRLAGVAGVGALLLLAVMPTGNVAFGMIPGCIGETSAWALLLGGLFLVYCRCIHWELPAAYIATVAVLVMVLPVKDAAGHWVGGFAGEFMLGRVTAHAFGGGLFLGAFFMITDMVTSPLTVRGQVVFGMLAGLLVAFIRLYGGYPEGVCYSILLANAARPLIDRYTMPRTFGARKKAGVAA